MPRATDSNATLSLTAAALSALYPEWLSGEEALNSLCSQTLNGLNDGPPHPDQRRRHSRHHHIAQRR